MFCVTVNGILQQLVKRLEPALIPCLGFPAVQSWLCFWCDHRQMTIDVSVDMVYGDMKMVRKPINNTALAATGRTAQPEKVINGHGRALFP